MLSEPPPNTIHSPSPTPKEIPMPTRLAPDSPKIPKAGISPPAQCVSSCSGFGRSSRSNPNPLQTGRALRTHRLHLRVIPESLMDDPAFVRIHRRQLNCLSRGPHPLHHLPYFRQQARLLLFSEVLHIHNHARRSSTRLWQTATRRWS